MKRMLFINNSLLIIIGFGLVAGLASGAQASNCELQNGKTLTGEYVHSSLAHGFSTPRDQFRMKLDLIQNGCELTLRAQNLNQYFWVESGKANFREYSSTTSTWILDLSGEKPAKIPREFIRANSNDPKSAAMTKSLEVRSKLNDDGTITIVASFDVENLGTTLRLSNSVVFELRDGPIYAGSNRTPFSGYINLQYPGIKVTAAPVKNSPRSVIFASGVTWLFDVLNVPLNEALGAPAFSLFRK